jgi:Uma2 family endonuclease
MGRPYWKFGTGGLEAREMVTKTLMTAEDLWAMPEVPGKRFELVRGELVEVSGAGGVHSFVARLLFRLLDTFVLSRGLGEVIQDGLGYIVLHDPDIVRIPDLSFVSAGRVPKEGLPVAYWPVAPDLAVEVVSPNDRAEDVHKKILEYLEGGTRLVWVLWPDTRSVTAHAADGSIRELGPDDELDGGDVLSGFRVRVGDLFDV